jgi:uncharacterized membrane protein
MAIRFRYSLAFCLLAVLSYLCGTASAVSFTRLDDLPGGSIATSISADGNVVVGIARIGPGSHDHEAFRWTRADGMVGLRDVPGGEFSSEAWDVSSDGSVVVGRSISESGIVAFRWTETDGMVSIGTLPDTFVADAKGVSADGSVIVGTSIGAVRQAFRWTHETGMELLRDTNGERFLNEAFDVSADGSVVVGEMHPTTGRDQAVRWSESSGVTSLGHNFANAISGDGTTIVGTLSGFTEAFRWTESTGVEPLGFLGRGTNSSAIAVSHDGSVVVGHASPTAQPGSGIFRWTEAEGMQNVGELLNRAGIQIGGWSTMQVRDVSGDGNIIVGTGFTHDGFKSWLIDLTDLEQAMLPGDYSGNGIVEQADLDLVLFNWGKLVVGAGELPGWRRELPFLGRVDQDELDRVLVNWGKSLETSGRGAIVPEPCAGILCMIGTLITLVSLGVCHREPRIRQAARDGKRRRKGDEDKGVRNCVWFLHHRGGATMIVDSLGAPRSAGPRHPRLKP